MTEYASKWEILDLLSANVKKTNRVELFNDKGKVQLVGGALGDGQGCSAFVEETKKDPMWRTKYYGVSYWFKGITDNDIIDRVTITKRAFWEITRLLPIKIFKIVKSFESIYSCEGGLKSKCLKQEEFCTACQELIRVGLKFAKDETIKDLIFCLAMFLQFSTTYRVYLQDIVGELNQTDFLKSPIKEIWRLKKLALKRKIGITDKLSFAVWIITLAVIFKRKEVCDFVSELDIDKIKLDSSDWYSCLRRSSYDFGGIPFEERLKEAERIDKKQGNLILGI